MPARSTATLAVAAVLLSPVASASPAELPTVRDPAREAVEARWHWSHLVPAALSTRRLGWRLKLPVYPLHRRLRPVARVEDSGWISGKLILEHVDGTRWLFKPPRNQAQYGVPANGHAPREVAARVVAEAIGARVAPTEMVVVDGVRGSAQRLVVGDELGGRIGRWVQDGRYMRHVAHDPDQLVDELVGLRWDDVQAIALLDYVIDNRDRHFGNLVVGPERGGLGSLLDAVRGRGRRPVWGIDHGLSFPTGRSGGLELGSYRLVVWGAELLGRRALEPALQQRIDELIERESSFARQARQTGRVDPRSLASQLAETGLDQSSIRAALERLERVGRYGLDAIFNDGALGLPSWLRRAWRATRPNDTRTTR